MVAMFRIVAVIFAIAVWTAVGAATVSLAPIFAMTWPGVIFASLGVVACLMPVVLLAVVFEGD